MDSFSKRRFTTSFRAGSSPPSLSAKEIAETRKAIDDYARRRGLVTGGWRARKQRFIKEG